MSKTNILKIYESSQTVFTAKDIALLLESVNIDNLKKNINYYAKTGKLIYLRRGIYAKSEEFNRYELATKIYTPSYISFETVLQKEGLIFQYYKSIFTASYLSRNLTIKKQQYTFRKIKSEILTNIVGIKKGNNHFIATKERAFLDTLYLFKNYHFDNIKSLSWDLVFKILPIYQNKRMEKMVQFFYKENKESKNA